MITKHDKTLTGRRNAEKVMNFPPGFNTGDGGGFDMQIPNKVRWLLEIYILMFQKFISNSNWGPFRL